DELTVTVGGHDLTVRAPAGASVDEVATQVLRAVGQPGPLLLDGRPLRGSGDWRSCGVRHGSVLTAGASPSPRPADPRWELRVVAGPAAGTVVPFTGAAVLGRAPGCDLVLDDAEVSRRHAELTLGTDGAVTVRDLGSTNGLAVDGLPVGSAGLPAGSVLRLGESMVVLAPRRQDPAALVRGPGPASRFNRPPRVVRPEPGAVEIEQPAQPTPPERGRLPMVTVLVPVALAGVLFLTMPSSPQYLLLMAMSPLMVVGNLVSDRRGGRRRHRAALRAHASAMAECAASVTDARLAEQQGRLAAAPDPAELLGRATLPSIRLWERRAGDPDAMLLRVGLGDLPSRVVLRPGAPATLEAVPVVLPLDAIGVLGVAGEGRPASALTRWLVGQAAILLAPGDLSVVVLTTPAAADDWQWLRWLPHARGSGPAACRVLVGTDEETCARRVAELTRLVDQRRSGRRAGGVPYGRVLLVVDGARDLRQVPGLAAVLADGPAVGILAVCRDVQERLLPQECSAVAVFAPGSATRLTVRDRDGATVSEVLADQVGADWAESVSRAMAALDDVAGPGTVTAGLLPEAVRLLDLVGPPTAESVSAHWSAGGSSTRAVVGVGTEGRLTVDLSADGPHALVAGTTGSGKSELLQTLVASLALANRPDALTFVLIDYKGGAAFRDCARLPHTVGLVTDLDGRLTERALASLTAELRHRERVLAEHGAKDIEGLWSQVVGAPPLARLVIVIDEFATLAEELPEFVRGLIGIAQRGRSLGIHLVLATQRPGGVVSPDIRANTNLRICLRVTQTTESSDVIDAPDAGEIAAGLAGRGFLRTGVGALQAFQAARVGGPATPPTAAGVATTVVEVPFPALGHPLPSPSAEPSITGPTDLSLLVDAVCAANTALGLPAPRRPWLEPLPERLTLDELPTDEETLPLGLLDLPARQQRLPYGLRLADAGHLLVAGAARSGRSTVLQTLAGTVARRWSADDLHVYALDFGNQALAPLAGLPHCGAVVGRDQPERLERLLSRLLAEVDRRQSALAAEGYADLAEQRRLAAPADRLPWLLLLVDRWEGLVQAYQDVDMGRRIEDLLRLLREGPSVGLRAVVTSDRSGLLGRLPSVIPDKLVLRLADRADYALADIPARAVPTSPPPGRGLVAGGGDRRTVHDVQIALLAGDPAGPAQLAALRALVSGAALRHSGVPVLHPPIRVDPLPPAVTVGHALSLGPTAAEAAGLWALIGVGGDQLRPVGVDLAEDGPGFLVVGAPRSGRSTALLTMAESLLRGGRQVCLVAPGRSPLLALAGHPGVTGCLDAASPEDEIRRGLTGSERPPVVVVDDAERLTDTTLGSYLEGELRAERGSGACILAAGNNEDLQATYRGFTLDLRRSRCGLLLNPQSSLDGDLLGARLPRQLGSARHPGRALLAVRGELTPVQVART
ncbi:MAG: segregation ATPase FtsK/SpoIIIE, family, partial [Frankiales bacterium]|nr:segregation ATPase FtsK/SpoIIIE, family [Frankiales bacterium]